jgi:hypothetical protein
MRSLKERLEQSVTTLDKLERRREDTHSPAFGLDTEWSIIQNELRELEADILDNPGALEKFLIRIRPTE